MPDYSMMSANPYGPFGLGGVNPQQQNMAGANPYMRAPISVDQVGSNDGGQGGPIPLGQPDANGNTLNQLSAPNGGTTMAQKAMLANVLMSAVQGHNPNVGAVQPLGSLPPGILQGS